MALSDDLSSYVKVTFQRTWTVREGKQVPAPEDLPLSNVAAAFDRATVLYADLSGSTSMVENKNWEFAAEVYKNFLYCSARLITEEGGIVTAYDGDRVMGVFIGEVQTTPAARCALKINYVVKNVIQPALIAQYPYASANFEIKQVVGIDSSSIKAARTGVRGYNDLVWVGEAANLAAKLTDLDEGRSWITERAYKMLQKELKFHDGKSMWEQKSWTSQKGITVYKSNWTWRP